MRYLKYVALMAVLMMPLAYSQAQVGVGIGVRVGPGYYAGPPVCSYGYYDYAPYACAPYGFYGPDYFVDGVFIGAGPWYHWGHPAWYWNRGFYGRPGWGRGYYGGRFYDRDHDRGFDRDRGYARGFERGEGRGEHEFHGHGEVRGGGNFHGGGGFRGEGGSHGGFHGGRR
ncbi:MAG TPA: hypothetical protein VE377_16985 [Candidatus Dormibacteraeota bacterium]|nr:hypothetical protein [Candidatus Dormibacteraeota bacterium]